MAASVLPAVTAGGLPRHRRPVPPGAFQSGGRRDRGARKQDTTHKQHRKTKSQAQEPTKDQVASTRALERP
eukprot:9000004-Alexandrium_andersonii.AAC.1